MKEEAILTKAAKIIRKNVEEEIHEHLNAIREIYYKYNPDGEYLSMVIFPKRGLISVNNSHYAKDRAKPIDAFWIDDDAEPNFDDVPFMDA